MVVVLSRLLGNTQRAVVAHTQQAFALFFAMLGMSNYKLCGGHQVASRI